jgi:GNAT superfamily N-acetyltransferase
MVLIAEDDHGERVGFATLSHETHFTGERQAYINELAISDVAEGRGVGTALIAACEQWAREQGGFSRSVPARPMGARSISITTSAFRMKTSNWSSS